MQFVRAGKTLLCVVTLFAASIHPIHAEKKLTKKQQQALQQQQVQQPYQEPVQSFPVAQPLLPYNPAENQLTLEQLVDRAIAETAKRRLTAGVHTPWQVVHGILALRWDFQLMKGPGSAETINAIEWMASGPIHEGLPLWQVTPYGGRGQPYTHPYAFEGHPTQFMGYMTMADIPEDYKFKAGPKGEQSITIRDIINDAKMQVQEGPEITWTLWALSHYESPDAEWTNAVGEPWSIERLVRIQTAEQVTTGACGGCHGLFALAYARNKYLATGQPLRGVWLEADQKIKRYIEEARSLQNADGTFSSKHFAGPGWTAEFTPRIATSGHQLEWLMVALPKSRLNEEWVRRAVERVARDIWEHRREPSDCGPLFHAVHSLVMYRLRTRPTPTPSSPADPQLTKKRQPETAVSRPVPQPRNDTSASETSTKKLAEVAPTPNVSSSLTDTKVGPTANPGVTVDSKAGTSAKDAERTEPGSSATTAAPSTNVARSAEDASSGSSTARLPAVPKWVAIQRRAVSENRDSATDLETVHAAIQRLLDPDLDLGSRDGADLGLPPDAQKSATAVENPKGSSKRMSTAPSLR